MTENTRENLLCTPLLQEATKLFPGSKIVPVIKRTKKISKNDTDLIIDLVPENNPRSAWLRYLYMSQNHEGGSNAPNYFGGLHYSDIVLCAAGYFKPNRVLHSVSEKAPVFVTDDINEAVKKSFLDTRVVYISPNGDVLMYGPYGQGHFIVRPRGDAHKSGINKKDVEKLFSDINKEKFLNIGADVWISRFDRAGFLEYVPFTAMDINKEELLKWIYRTTWKSTINRNVIVGDPQRFLAVGEKYIDRVLDIDKEVEDLYEKVLARYNAASVSHAIKSLGAFCAGLEELKKLSFEGLKFAKELLSSAAIRGEKPALTHDEKIFNVAERVKELNPIIDFFRVSKESERSKDMFPVLKNI
ncbi:MAG: hypothetical protein V1647_00920, partial [Pseudomonadota bacterium]